MRQALRTLGIVAGFLAAIWLLGATLTFLGASLFGDWRLEFRQLHSGGRVLALSLLCGVAAGCIASLFRYERQLISQRLGFALLALRLSLLGILFLTLLEPTWTWSRQEQIEGRVLVACDLSESMNTVDAQGSQAEKLRWARSIGVLANPEIGERAQGWLDAWNAGREPEWVDEDEAPDPQQREQLAQARRQNVDALLSEVGQFSRLQLAQRALSEGAHAPLIELSDRVTLNLAGIAGGHVPLTTGDVEHLDDLKDLPLDRSHSNLLAAIDAVGETSGKVPLVGIVLVSDGHDTDQRRQGQLLDRMKSLNVPVHTVLVGSEQRPRDLAIIHVDAPESIFKEDQPQVKAILHTAGFEGARVPVSISWIDEPDRPAMKQTVVPRGPSFETTFTLPKMNVGRHRLRLRLDPASGESRDDNNSRDFSISVVDDQARVLLVDEEGRWEFRFLDNALVRDRRLSVDHILFDQPFMGLLDRPFFPSNMSQLARAEGSGTAFGKYDIVILGDLSPQHLTPQVWQQLDQYVREEGGTLVLTAVRRFASEMYTNPVARTLLPLEDLRPLVINNAAQSGPPPQRGFRLKITSDGEQLPMFQLDADPAVSRAIWGQLPGHPWGLVGQARGSASVWASAAAPGRRPDLQQERRDTLIAQHYLGTGQVVWIGVDSTWRWRYLVGERYHHRFWGQLVRWAVSFKAAARDENLRFGLRESVIPAGHPAVIQVRWDERFLASHPQLKARARIERTSEGEPLTQQVELNRAEGLSSLSQGSATDLPPGEYRIRLELEGVEGAQRPAPEVMLVVNPEVTPELQDVSANRPLLQKIASATGGQFLYLDQIDRLPDLFTEVRQTSTIREEIPLWSHWFALVLLCAVAMGEWVLRKLNGLP